MTKLFGTDGIRGRAGEFPLDASTIPLIGRALGEQLGSPILIGRDPRVSSPWILDLLRQGLESAGVEVQDGGVLPTPAVALLTQQTPARGGVMISASHNSFEDNGIKAFGPDGKKLEDAEEASVERRVQEYTGPELEFTPTSSTTKNGARPSESSRHAELYLGLLAERFPRRRWLEGLRIVADCANGAMSEVAPRLLESMGAEVCPIHANPTGKNINDGCGAVYPESLVEHVKEVKPHLGVAFDGDGDRSIFASSTGRIVDGDSVLFIMARTLRDKGLLEPSVVVGTSMTNYGLEQALEGEGIKLIRTDVGDRYVFKEMLSTGAQLGGEPSGHIIFPDFCLSGDGLLTTLKLCEAMVRGQAPLDQLTEGRHRTPQLLKSVKVEERIPLDSLPTVSSKIREIANRLEGRGRIVVRYSGTEPLLRIMIESDSSDTNTAYADELIAEVRHSLPTLKSSSPNR